MALWKPRSDYRKQKSLIYMLVAPNGKKYIGQTKMQFRHRMAKHKHACKTSETKLGRSVQKYGWENFKKKVIWLCDPDDLDRCEKMFIAKYKCVETGLNHDIGGVGRKNYKRKASSNKLQSIAMLKKPRKGSIVFRKTKSGEDRYIAEINFHKRCYLGSFRSRTEADKAIERFKKEHNC